MVGNENEVTRNVDRAPPCGPISTTVSKALQVLEAVASEGRAVRFVDLLKSQPFPKSTLHRLLRTLVSQGMLEHNPEHHTYRPGLRLIRLAHYAWRQSNLPEAAGDALDALASEIAETIHLAVLDHAQVLYVDKRHSEYPMSLYASVGKVAPAYCTGIGKAMLAYLPEKALEDALDRQAFHRYTGSTVPDAEALRVELAEIRRAGYSLDREEYEPGVICIAVPILSDRRRLHGGLSITGNTRLTNLEKLTAHAPRLSQAADEIAAQAALHMLAGA
ncbi:IclR family transcriptional regulator [Bauldia sp.]|uniref:IclR family transcriptional regulator n=1 Tax=Bauldia sp. TaxID=2575872 RepID=UPI003BA91118